MGALAGVWRDTHWNENAEGSPELGMVYDGTRMRRTFKVFWNSDTESCAKKGTAQKDFIGFASVATHPGTGKKYISRSTPFVYPHVRDKNDKPFLYCMGCPGMRGVGALGADDQKVQTFKHALLDLEFRALPYRIMEDEDINGAGEWEGVPDEGAFVSVPAKRRYCTRLFRPASKIVTIPQGSLFVIFSLADPPPANKKPVPFRVPIPFRQSAATVIYNWQQVPEEGLPLSAYQGQMNTLNDALFDGYASPQTLLFETFDIKPYVSPFGERIADVQLLFRWLPNCSLTEADVSFDGSPKGTPRGHNYVLFQQQRLGSKLDFYPVTDNGKAPGPLVTNGQAPYRLSSFADLFRPPQA